MRYLRTPLGRYAFAVVATAAATVLKLIFPNAIGHEAPLAIYLGVIMVVAWFGGVGPGMLATGLSALAGCYWFTLPYGSFRISNVNDLVRIAFGLIEGTLISVLAGHLREAERKATYRYTLLEESDSRFHAIFDSVSDGVILHDLETGAFVEVNPRACEMFGYTRDELLRMSIEGLSAGASASNDDARHRVMRAVLGSRQTFDWEAKTKDGQPMWVEVSLRRVPSRRYARHGRACSRHIDRRRPVARSRARRASLGRRSCRGVRASGCAEADGGVAALLARVERSPKARGWRGRGFCVVSSGP
jgi:PAS domain S-box-containing protein